ncbi:MAG: hypothetical protein CL681_06605 [Blastopirellula sp.]|jgi:hypothetical protein|nr:hypothetical protein [Blastopirellula sp.]
MIIWGSTNLTSTTGSSTFHCPECDMPQNGNLKQVRNYFTLYFIPLIPLDIAGTYVECTACGAMYDDAILDYDPEKNRQELYTQMLRVMVMAALSDGIVDDGERAEIQKQYMELAGLPVPGDILQDEINMAEESGADLNSYIRHLTPDLSDHGKALVVKLAFHTMSAAASGLQAGHQDQLARLAETLGIPDPQYRELITTLIEVPE